MAHGTTKGRPGPVDEKQLLLQGKKSVHPTGIPREMYVHVPQCAQARQNGKSAALRVENPRCVTSAMLVDRGGGAMVGQFSGGDCPLLLEFAGVVAAFLE